MTRNDQNHSNGAFPARGWTRATFCDPKGGNCVEINTVEINSSATGRVGVRDSKRPRGVVLAFGSAAWRDFLTDARRGGFDY